MPEEREFEKSKDEAESPEVEGHLGAARSDEDGGEEGAGLAAKNEGLAARNDESGEG